MLQKRAFYMLGAVLMAVGLFSVLGTASAAPTQAQPTSLYEKLQQQAGNGNTQAQNYLSRVQEFLAQKRQPSPPTESDVNTGQKVNGVTVAAKGREPFFVKLYNRQEFRDLATIDSYAKSRKSVLARVGRESPSRRIGVSVSPKAYADVGSIWKLKEAHGLDIDEMVVALLLDGDRHSVMRVTDEVVAGRPPLVDFTQPATAIETRLRQLIPTKPFPNGVPGSDELQLKVEWLRGTMPAADAVALDSSPMIWLVDPTADILDAYAGRALDVGVVSMPSLLSNKNRMEQASQLPAPPSSPQPTPSPRAAGR